MAADLSPAEAVHTVVYTCPAAWTTETTRASLPSWRRAAYGTAKAPR